MSSKKPRVDVSQIYVDIIGTVTSNKLRGKEVTKRKLANINIGNGKKLGTKSADAIISRYDKYIKF